MLTESAARPVFSFLTRWRRIGREPSTWPISSTITIREVTQTGAVTTLAGLAGVSGSTDGTGSEARFYGPSGLAIGRDGNLYVSDGNNHTIRKVTPAGVVTTLAGLAGMPGSADGTGSQARFFGPHGLASDSEGNLYPADTQNSTIRKITPDGVVSTVAGLAGNIGSRDGRGTEARFYSPYSVATDSSDNVYVADTQNSTIRRMTPEGDVTTVAGLAGSRGSDDGVGSDARFFEPYGVSTDAGDNVYVTDLWDHTVRHMTPAGEVTTFTGVPGSGGQTDGTGAAARFNQPRAVTTDAEGNVFVADMSNHTIRKATPAGVVTTLAGRAGVSGSADGLGGDARFNNPTGLTADSEGNLYVADNRNHTVRKVTPEGVVMTVAGLAGNPGSVDGTGSAARFFWPAGIASDSAGNLYVAESGNYTIRKVTPEGVVTTVAGLAGVPAARTASVARRGSSHPPVWPRIARTISMWRTSPTTRFARSHPTPW